MSSSAGPNLIALALAATILLAATLAVGQGAAQPRGLYVYSYPAFIRSGEYERALSVKGIDGAAGCHHAVFHG